MKKFDIHSWNRKAHFDFFKDYEDPFFNVTIAIDVTVLKAFCKENNLPFWLANYYYAMKYSSEIQEFRLRLHDGVIYEHTDIKMGTTILNHDNTFSFCYFPMTTDVFEYVKKAESLMDKYRKGETEFYDDKDNLGIVHGTIVPWLAFTGVKHARSGKERYHGIPKFAFGKYYQEEGKLLIPFSIEAHHALIDGYHVGKFVTLYQEMINQL